MASFTEDQLVIIAIALDEEEGENQLKNKRVWVHKAWTNRELDGEYITLYKELVDDERKFFEYFRMSQNCFNILLNKIENYLLKQDTRWRKAITPRERLAVCLR